METKTLRDELAMSATKDEVIYQIELLKESRQLGDLPVNYPSVARYMHADAMLRAREYAAEYQ